MALFYFKSVAGDFIFDFIIFDLLGLLTSVPNSVSASFAMGLLRRLGGGLGISCSNALSALD